ncbi:hypothetical protein LEN26_003830 [Aphanomyces euteiches]|nr:hypothetical protein LEN26_012754 [Aphanomyces euteiches]KAH9151648.1 hypothetical protein LEN26_003830 [Aphanomyces euteiches]
MQNFESDYDEASSSGSDIGGPTGFVYDGATSAHDHHHDCSTFSNQEFHVTSDDHQETRRDERAEGMKRRRVDPQLPTCQLTQMTEETPVKRDGGPTDGRTKIFVGGYEFTKANATRVKVTYRCSFYRSQSCPGRLVFYSSTMNYDFDNAIPHTCVPPSQLLPTNNRGANSLWVMPAMKQAADNLAVTTDDSPSHIWELLSNRFYSKDTNTVVRGLTKIQVVKRVHRARELHYGSNVHGRVEVPPLSVVRNSVQRFSQFHHVWSNLQSNRHDKLERVIGWGHPQLIQLLRYEKISLFIDGTFHCTPANFSQCVVVMVYDRATRLFVPVYYVLATSKSYDTYWNLLQYITDSLGETMQPKDVVCDFEKALVNAVCDHFPTAQLMGCFFHFKQACQRRMKKYSIPPQQVEIAMAHGS